MNFEEFFEVLKKNKIDFFTGVPDSFLNGFCNYLTNNISTDKHIIAANEGNAIAIASGYHMATGKLPLVYMQNSGIGNAINPLISLAAKEVFSIPMVLLIGWRGQPGIDDWIQHELQGATTKTVFEDLNMPIRVMKKENYVECLDWASRTAMMNRTPVAIVVEKGVLTERKSTDFKKNYAMNREDVIRCVIQNAPKDSLFVATTGRATRELFFIREELKQTHDKDFLNVGAMGHASSIALGLAIGNPNKMVYCLDGDASAIMHMGSMAINGNKNTKNLVHIIMNNGLHESVGGQPSVGFKVDFTAIASGCGYKTIGKPIISQDELINEVKKSKYNLKPLFLDVRVRPGIRSEFGSLDIDHLKLKEEFMKSM